MKKFVLLSDGKNFSTKTFDFIRSLHEKEPFLLTGAFFHSINYALLIPNTFAADSGPYQSFTKEQHNLYVKGINDFQTSCIQHHIEYRVHQESEEWNINDLVKESRFADLLIVCGELFFADHTQKQPNEFLRDVLNAAECPVLVVPEHMKPIQRISVAYDGKKESMYALKMFCNVFAQFTDLPVDIDYWVEKTDDEIPDLEYLEEFAGRHFSNINFGERYFDARKYLATWTNYNKNSLFVCGAYHRSGISNWFRKSFAEEIIKQHSVAVFIAHHN